MLWVIRPILFLIFLSGCQISLTTPTVITPSPTISSLSSNAALSAGGTLLTITGTDFAPTAIVKVGSTACNSTVYTDNKHLICAVPAATSGASYIGKQDITVTNSDGKSATLTDSFLYIGNPELWLSADTGITQSAGNVTAWADQSVYNNHATTRGGVNAPTFQTNVSALNGKPAVHFDGAAGLIPARLDRHQGLSAQSYFGVGVTEAAPTTSQSFYWFSTTSAGATRSNFQIGDNGFPIVASGSALGPINFSGRTLDSEGSIGQVLGGTVTIGTGFLASGTTDYLNQTVKIYQDTSPTVVATNFQSVGPMSSGAAADACIGCAGAWGRYFSGSIGEMIIYHSLLTDVERQLIENYLKSKYHTP